MTLQRKITRSIKKNLSFYLTGSLLTAITVMLLIGAFAVSSPYIPGQMRIMKKQT